MQSPRDIYNNRIDSYKQLISQLAIKDKQHYYFRLACFILIVAVTILLFNIHWLAAILFIYIAFGIFYFIVKAHNKIRTQKRIAESISVINQYEIDVLDHNFNHFDGGVEFQNPLHPYINDLDIFGTNSLYQYSNRCNTQFGKSLLAKIYKEGLDPINIPSYQKAILELEAKVDWRQNLWAITNEDGVENKIEQSFFSWLIAKKSINVKKVFFYIIPIITICLFYLLSKYSEFGAILSLLPAGLFAFRNAKQINQEHNTTTNQNKVLDKFASSLEFISNSEFNHSLLREKQNNLAKTSIQAHKELSRLAYIIRQLDIRYNFFGMLFNLIFPWDYYWVNRLQEWKERNKDYVKNWFDSIAWFEAMSSFATLGFNNPDWTFPLITEEKVYKASDIAHPLIHKSKRIVNDFNCPTKQHIKIVTGSNMGGKSTFLRTIGINTILAYCGSKVCATNLSLPILKLHTSMRTLDALDENTSSFYAELKRLKMVLDAVKINDNIFFLLDEILKGTNTNDRHTGAKALITQLLSHNGAGLISTHDLKLGELAKAHPSKLENICFEVEVRNNELHFDYKIKKGVSKSFNATHLMRNMGIDI